MQENINHIVAVNSILFKQALDRYLARLEQDKKDEKPVDDSQKIAAAFQELNSPMLGHEPLKEWAQATKVQQDLFELLEDMEKAGMIKRNQKGTLFSLVSESNQTTH